ncbi:hypothetical protein D3C85_1455840 [compost metagenome]
MGVITKATPNKAVSFPFTKPINNVNRIGKGLGYFTKVKKDLCPLVDGIKVTSATHSTELKAAIGTKSLNVHRGVTEIVVHQQAELAGLSCFTKLAQQIVSITSTKTEQVAFSMLSTIGD